MTDLPLAVETLELVDVSFCQLIAHDGPQFRPCRRSPKRNRSRPMPRSPSTWIKDWPSRWYMTSHSRVIRSVIERANSGRRPLANRDCPSCPPDSRLPSGPRPLDLSRGSIPRAFDESRNGQASLALVCPRPSLSSFSKPALRQTNARQKSGETASGRVQASSDCKFSRPEAALRSSAVMILELPVVFSSSSVMNRTDLGTL